MKHLDFHQTIASIVMAFQNVRTKHRRKSQLREYLKSTGCESECLERALGFLIRKKFLSANAKKDQQFEMIGKWTFNPLGGKVHLFGADEIEIDLEKGG